MKLQETCVGREWETGTVTLKLGDGPEYTLDARLAESLGMNLLTAGRDQRLKEEADAQIAAARATRKGPQR